MLYVNRVAVQLKNPQIYNAKPPQETRCDFSPKEMNMYLPLPVLKYI